MVKIQKFCNNILFLKQIVAGIIIFIGVLTIVALFSASAKGSTQQIELDYSFSEPMITEWNVSNTTYCNITMNGTYTTGDIGFPLLPVKPLNILLPQKGILESINVSYSGNTSMGYGYNVTIGGQNQSNETEFNSSIPYPNELVRNLGISYFRGYSILTCQLYPIHYVKDTGEIYYYENMTINITTNNTGSVDRFFRGLEKDEILMKELVDDYSMNYTYTSLPNLPYNSTIFDPNKEAEFVIITKEDFVNPSPPPGIRGWGWKTFQDLADYKTDPENFKISTEIVTVEQIYSDSALGPTEAYGDYDSYFQDHACRIRNFIRFAHNNWGTDYVLLGGDNITDNGEEFIPARNLWYKWKKGSVVHSGTLPSDMYYACIHGSFNGNKNDYWGEPWDGTWGGDFDEPENDERPRLKYYAEADPDEDNNDYKVGLFTRPFDLSDYPNFIVWLQKYFNKHDDLEKAQIRVYSGGKEENNRIQDLTFDITGLGTSVFSTGNINLTNFPDKSEVYVEFYYECSGVKVGRSLNIDNIYIFYSNWPDPEEIFCIEDFEDPWVENGDEEYVPDVDWDMEYYDSTPGSWKREPYHVDVDLLGEVFVGRAPVGNYKEASNFVDKTIKYEDIKPNDWFIKKVFLVGGKVVSETSPGESGKYHCKLVLEEIPNGYENVEELYDECVDEENDIWEYYTRAQLRRSLDLNYHIFYDSDHGIKESIINPDFKYDELEFYRFSYIDSLFLINLKPFFWFGDSCLTGAFDEVDCLAEYLTVKIKRGPFAVIANSQDSFNIDLTDGEGKDISQWFFNTMFIKGFYELGRANQISKNTAENQIKSERKNQYKCRMDVYERNLFGDPTVSIKLPVSNNNPVEPNMQGYSVSDKFFNLYKYTFYVNAIDSDEDQVSYKWKINNIEMPFWTQYYNSGDNVSKVLWLPSGTHQIKVKARDINLNESNWSDSSQISVSFDSNIQIDASTAVLGEQIQFNGQASEGTEPYTWYYDFGDGNYSNEQNTSHSYGSLGTYNVTLNVTDSQNISSNVTKVVNIVILNSDFDCSPSSGTLNETINFNDVSNGYHTLVNWSWDFGDGNTSYNINPGHQYAAEGVYNVSLMVTDNQSNTNTSYQTIYIDSGDPVVTSCFSDLDEVGYGYNVTITTNVTDSISGVKNVTINITYPDDAYGCFTMNNINGNTYEYVFDDTYQLGDFSYKVWVVDHAENHNCSAQKNFKVIRSFGCQRVGNSNQTIWDTITGSRFKINLTGVADNISVYIDPGNVTSDYHYQCVIYRHNDSTLIGISEEKNVSSGKGWKKFDFTVPKPVLMNDTEYVLCCWSDNDTVRMYYDNVSEEEMFYDDGTSSLLGHYFEGLYNYTPDINNFDHEDRRYSIYCRYTPDNTSPVITNVSDNPDTVGFGFNVTITADVADNQSGVEIVTVNITYPDSTTVNYTMNNTGNDTYQYVFSDTWLVGQYNYTIWTIDYIGNSNTSTGYSFNVSAQATISVCTIKDEYGNNETINLTDPPGNLPSIGYELLDNGKVLRIWNNYDSYYFNTSSGIQLTNHYNKYWSHNVLMLGYYNNNQWYLIYRTDELSGFNKNIDTDNETYVNATLWKDLTYLGYDFRLAIRYHLGVDDKELTVIPYIKNLGQVISYTLGFAWEINDIRVDMTPGGDYIEINGTTYYLNQSLDKTYKNMNQSCFYIREDISSVRSESLYLCWNDSLDYLVKVKSRNGQYNAPVTLGIKIGTLGVGQEKYTSLFWHDASEITYYFNNYNTGEAWATNPSYMVDDSISTYASTNIDGDVELCDGNNCSGDYLGSISQVELRVYSYYTGSQRDTILRPVFNGTTDGLDYRYQTPPSIQPAWSPWFDITSDPFAPESWSWTDVLNLDCDVEAGDDMLGFTLYCSKIELRVTYTPEYPPGISDPFPADGSIGITIAPVLNITVADPDGDNMNIIWLSNSSGSWIAFGNNNSVGNGTYHQTMVNASVNGQWWYWKVNVTDGTNYNESSVYKFYTGYESKINNTGSYHFKGYLLIQVQYYNETSQSWVVADDTINESSPRTVLWADPGGTPGQNILALDTIFNGLVSTSDLSGYGNGTYRVYACFRDPEGNVLVCDDDSLMEATYEFAINL